MPDPLPVRSETGRRLWHGHSVRVDLAQAAAQQLKEVGIDCTVEIPVQPDWAGQMAYLIGWGSPRLAARKS